jgi:hypothetical protein
MRNIQSKDMWRQILDRMLAREHPFNLTSVSVSA